MPVLVVLGACFDSDGGETIADPGGDIFHPLFRRAPHAEIQAPITLDTKSCAYALYTQTAGALVTFVLIHPLRSKCELWLGANGITAQYCRFDRKHTARVVVYFKGDRQGDARPVDFVANDRRPRATGSPNSHHESAS